MKKLLDISSEERNRILEMHQSATKRNYLSEEAPQPGQTSNILPGAETVESYAIPKTRFNQVSGADLGTIINLYRNGKKQGSITGKDRAYYWITEAEGPITSFVVKELYLDGSLRGVMGFNYRKSDKSWTFYEQYPESSKTATDNWNQITSDSKLKGNKWSFFWRDLVNSIKGLDGVEITRFLQANKTKNVPYTLKDAIANKTYLMKDDENDITDQKIAEIKSSVAYKAI
jgi:hypothetical protein